MKIRKLDLRAFIIIIMRYFITILSTRYVLSDSTILETRFNRLIDKSLRARFS